MSKSVVIIGASGHGKVIADIVISSGDKLIGFLDDNVEKGSKILNFEVLGKTEDYKNFQDCEFIVAIGNQKVRKNIAEKLHVKWYTAIHPSAVISKFDVEVGEGTAVMANAVINASTKIGKHCIINTSSVIEHDNVLEDYVHISPGAALAGTVKVGKLTHIGIGAVVKNNVSICESCNVGAGATVIKNITESGTYIGVPVRKIK